MEMHPLAVHLKVAASVDDEAEAAVVAIEMTLPLQSKAKARAMQRKMETTLKTHHRKMVIQTSPALKALKVADASAAVDAVDADEVVATIVRMMRKLRQPRLRKRVNLHAPRRVATVRIHRKARVKIAKVADAGDAVAADAVDAADGVTNMKVADKLPLQPRLRPKLHAHRNLRSVHLLQHPLRRLLPSSAVCTRAIANLRLVNGPRVTIADASTGVHPRFNWIDRKEHARGHS